MTPNPDQILMRLWNYYDGLLSSYINHAGLLGKCVMSVINMETNCVLMTDQMPMANENR